MKPLISVMIVMFILLTFLSTSVITRNNNENSLRTWTSYCTISLIGTNKSFSTTWNMSGGALVDREKKTKEYILSQWINNSAIWKLLGLNVNEIDTWCQKGGGDFRIIFGFDKRKKDWTFDKTVTIKCHCSGSLIFN